MFILQEKIEQYRECWASKFTAHQKYTDADRDYKEIIAKYNLVRARLFWHSKQRQPIC